MIQDKLKNEDDSYEKKCYDNDIQRVYYGEYAC